MFATERSGQPVEPSSPLSPVDAPLRSQVSSLMNTSPRKTGSGIAVFTNPQGVGSLAPLVLPGLWRRASVPSGFSLQQQMSSLGQQYLPEAKSAQLVPYGSALNLPGQVEDNQSVSGNFVVMVHAAFCWTCRDIT